MTLKATAETTGGAFGLVEASAPVGSGPPLHIHEHEDEAFWILEGSLGSLRHRDLRGASGLVHVPPAPRPAHVCGHRGSGPDPVDLHPGGFERFFVYVGRPAETDGLRPAGPVDVATLARIGGEYGVQFVGSPLTPGLEAMEEGDGVGRQERGGEGGGGGRGRGGGSEEGGGEEGGGGGRGRRGGEGGGGGEGVRAR